MGTIVLVRHGQASFGAAEYDALSPLGFEQAGRLGQSLAAREIDPDVLVSGSLKRQASTAAEIAMSLTRPGATLTDPAWNEFDHEPLMRTVTPTAPTDPAEFQQALEVTMRRWYQGSLQGTETFEEFGERIDTALRNLASSLPPGGQAIVVTSAGVIGWIVASLLGTGVDQWIHLNRVCVNTSATTVVTGRRGLSLISYNEHTHLTRDMVSYR